MTKKLCLEEQLEKLNGELNRIATSKKLKDTNKFGKQVELLSKHISAKKYLARMLGLVFDIRVRTKLPVGTPKYRPNFECNETLLISELQKETLLEFFVIDGVPLSTDGIINHVILQKHFIELMESLHPKDALLLLDIKDKKFPNEKYISFTPELIKAAMDDASYPIQVFVG